MVLGGVGLLLVALFAVMYYALQRRSTALVTPARPVAEAPSMAGTTPPLEHYIKIPTSFAGLDRRPLPDPQPPEPPPAPPIPPLFPVQAQIPPLPPVAPPPVPPASTQPPRQAPPVQPVQAPPPKAQAKPRRYMFVPTPQVGKSPFPTPAGEKPDGEALASGGPPGQKGTLIKEAQWEQPAEVTKTWYMSQGVTGLTTTAIVSDIGGPVVIRVSRDLQDKFLNGHTLIPQHALIIAEQAGQPQFGASRLAVTLKQIELPDGSVLSLKTNVGDATGAAGLRGSTNYHWGRVLAGAGLSALLSIGTRIPTGNQEGFAPTIGQETSQQVGSSVARTGNQIVQRELNVSPTITIPASTLVTIHPAENITFTRAPKVVR
jgi:type IV secretion system protein VirB10